MKIFKNKWSKWQHVIYVEHFTAGINTYEILKRTNLESGLVQYRRIYIGDCVHGLASMLKNNLINK
jgi:hypothetical protein